MKKRRNIITILGGMALVMICAYLIASAFVLESQVKGESMYPTLSDGDRLVIDRISYRLHEPKRFDIIVFPYKYREETYYIKRIIGLPGENVKIENNKIFINGNELEDDYGNGEIINAGLASYGITLSADEYFVLGDNRSISRDSREPDVGNVKKSDIIGKAFFRIFPLTEVKMIN